MRCSKCHHETLYFYGLSDMIFCSECFTEIIEILTKWCKNPTWTIEFVKKKEV